TSFLASRLPGSLYDRIVDQGKLATGAPSISLDRAAPKSFVLTIGSDVAPEVPAEKLLAEIDSYVSRLAENGISAETIERFKRRFADARATADQDPNRVYDRLVSWLAGRNRYDGLRTWPERIAAVSSEDVATVLRGLSAPGRIVTGT